MADLPIVEVPAGGIANVTRTAAAASQTRFLVFSLTGPESFIAAETVAIETPACRATSRMVAMSCLVETIWLGVLSGISVASQQFGTV